MINVDLVSATEIEYIKCEILYNRSNACVDKKQKNLRNLWISHKKIINMTELNSVQKFYEDKTVFITGGEIDWNFPE